MPTFNVLTGTGLWVNKVENTKTSSNWVDLTQYITQIGLTAIPTNTDITLQGDINKRWIAGTTDNELAIQYNHGTNSIGGSRSLHSYLLSLANVSRFFYFILTSGYFTGCTPNTVPIGRDCFYGAVAGGKVDLIKGSVGEVSQSSFSQWKLTYFADTFQTPTVINQVPIVNYVRTS